MIKLNGSSKDRYDIKYKLTKLDLNQLDQFRINK